MFTIKTINSAKPKTLNDYFSEVIKFLLRHINKRIIQ